MRPKKSFFSFFLVGVSEIDAKYKYVKLARSLDTFGVHFFLVKVGGKRKKEGRKKLKKGRKVIIGLARIHSVYIIPYPNWV